LSLSYFIASGLRAWFAYVDTTEPNDVCRLSYMTENNPCGETTSVHWRDRTNQMQCAHYTGQV